MNAPARPADHPAPAAPRRPPDWAPVALAAAGYLASAAACCVLAARRHDPFLDLFIYRAGGRAVLGGAQLYQLRFAWQLRFTYPPFAALVFVPLAWLPRVMVPPLAMAVNVAALPVTLWLALRLPPARSRLGGRKPTAAVTLSLAAATAAIWLEPVRTNLAYGQVNLLITVLILADLALPDSSRGKGAAIGIAAGLKLTPAIFAVYLVLTRRYRAAAVSAAAAGLTVALGTALLPGDSAAFWGSGVADPARIGRVENAANQSLRGALARLLHTVNVQPAWLAVAAVVAAAGLATAVLAGRRGDEAQGFARCAITGLLISPVSWSHHWVLAVPALLLGCARAWRSRSVAALAALAVVAAVAWARIIWHVPTGGAAELHLNPLQQLAADAYVLAGLAALAVVAVVAVHELIRLRNVGGPCWNVRLRNVGGLCWNAFREVTGNGRQHCHVHAGRAGQAAGAARADTGAGLGDRRAAGATGGRRWRWLRQERDHGGPGGVAGRERPGPAGTRARPDLHPEGRR